MFICTRNSARSQLAAALWAELSGHAALSAGTHPATRVHPGAIAAAERAGLDLSARRPHELAEIGPLPAIVVTVCDQAHEELDGGPDWLHWSITDPVTAGTKAAFDRAVREIRDRVQALVESERTR